MILLRSSSFVITLLVAIGLSNEQLYKRNRQLPSFGRAMRQEFLMNSELVLLNHGNYGAYPRAVLESLHDYILRVESSPDRWRRETRGELNKVRELIAKLVHASADDIVMIINATGGVNAVFRGMTFSSGDRILQFDTNYNAMQSIVEYICDNSNWTVTALTYSLIYPSSQDQIVRDFEAFLEKSYDPVRPIRVVLIDHIVSAPAAILPLDKMIPLLKARNITVVVDAAHALGQIAINITALQPDYYIMTCYKWFFTPKGCAAMYVDKKHQSTLHPAHINAAYTDPAEYQNEFYWTGTMDYSPYMSVIAAFKFREDVGGEEAIMSYNKKLAIDGGTYLAHVFGTEILQDFDQIANMIDVRLPINNLDDPRLMTSFFNEAMLFGSPSIAARPYKYGGRWYIRASAQIYTDLDDFEVLGTTLSRICDELNGSNSTGTSLTGNTATALAAYSAYSAYSFVSGKFP